MLPALLPALAQMSVCSFLKEMSSIEILPFSEAAQEVLPLPQTTGPACLRMTPFSHFVLAKPSFCLSFCA